jgi:photoactive yellow protein
MDVAFIEFGKADTDNALTQLTSDEIDNLAFGAIELDRNGRILQYNATESRITGRNPKEVIGRNFFSEIAPCCNRPEFRGVFEAGVASGALNTVIDYIFDYRMAPTRVKVHMKKALIGDNYWTFVKRL